MVLLICGAVCFVILCGGQSFIYPPALDAPGKMIFRVVFWLSFPVIMIVKPFFPGDDGHWSIVSVVLMTFLTPVFYWGLWRFLRRRSKRKAENNEIDQGRRRFIRRAAAGGVGMIGLGAASHASFIAPQLLAVRRYRVPIRDLPLAFNGLRIVQISDTHFGPYISRAYLVDAIDRANALAPDLIILTGDYVHRSRISVEPGIGLFSGLEARLGIVGVLGNHDHWEGADSCREVFRRIGIPLIDNDRLFLTAGGLTRSVPARDEGICIAGVGDLWEDRVLPDKALRDVPDWMPRLMLSHNPDAAEKIGAGHRIDLMFAGHTHGGQIALPLIGPPILPSSYGQKYEGGLCQGPAGSVVVSRGVGMAVLPVRFNVAPELVEATLFRMI